MAVCLLQTRCGLVSNVTGNGFGALNDTSMTTHHSFSHSLWKTTKCRSDCI